MGNPILPIILLGLICTVYSVPITEDASAVESIRDMDMNGIPIMADPIIVDPMADFGKLKEIVNDDNAGEKKAGTEITERVNDPGRKKSKYAAKCSKAKAAGGTCVVTSSCEGEVLVTIYKTHVGNKKVKMSRKIKGAPECGKDARRKPKYENKCTKAKADGGSCDVSRSCKDGAFVMIYRTHVGNTKKKMTYKVKGAPECKTGGTKPAATPAKGSSKNVFTLVTGQRCSDKFGYLSKAQCRDYQKRSARGYKGFFVVTKNPGSAPLGCYAKTRSNGDLVVVYNYGPTSEMCDESGGYECVCDNEPNDIRVKLKGGNTLVETN